MLVRIMEMVMERKNEDWISFWGWNLWENKNPLWENWMKWWTAGFFWGDPEYQSVSQLCSHGSLHGSLNCCVLSQQTHHLYLWKFSLYWENRTHSGAKSHDTSVSCSTQNVCRGSQSLFHNHSEPKQSQCQAPYPNKFCEAPWGFLDSWWNVQHWMEVLALTHSNFFLAARVLHQDPAIFPQHPYDSYSHYASCTKIPFQQGKIWSSYWEHLQLAPTGSHAMDQGGVEREEAPWEYLKTKRTVKNKPQHKSFLMNVSRYFFHFTIKMHNMNKSTKFKICERIISWVM